MDIDKEDVVILVYQLDSLLSVAIFVELNKTSEATYAMVYMHDVVAHLEGVKLRYGHLLVALNLIAQAVALVAVKYVVVRIYADLEVVINEALVEHYILGTERYLVAANLVEDVV